MAASYSSIYAVYLCCAYTTLNMDAVLSINISVATTVTIAITIVYTKVAIASVPLIAIDIAIVITVQLPRSNLHGGCALDVSERPRDRVAVLCLHCHWSKRRHTLVVRPVADIKVRDDVTEYGAVRVMCILWSLGPLLASKYADNSVTPILPSPAPSDCARGH